jgi:hypothetical protein
MSSASSARGSICPSRVARAFHRRLEMLASTGPGPRAMFARPLTALVVSPDGRTAASGDDRGTIVLLDVTTGTLLGRLTGGHS